MRTSRCETLLFSLLAAAAAACAQSQVRDSLPVPDLPGYRTLKCDFHLHTVFSDGEVWPTIRVMEAFRDGLDAIALTDHASYNPHREDVKTDLARPRELALGTAERLGIILVPGIEVNEGNIHYNALFVTDPNALRGVPLKEALIRARAQGGFAFWNHPGWRGTAQWFPLVAELHEAGLFHGMELLNGPSYYDEAYPWVEQRKLTIFANSDVHGLVADSYGKRNRPVTLVFARTADAAGIREALAARRTAAWMNGELWGSAADLAGLWKGAVRPESEALEAEPGGGVALRLRNTSALPFRLQYKGGPSWLRVRGADVRPEATTALALAFAKDAPAGGTRVTLEFEAANLHTGPGRALALQVPLTIRVAPR